MGCRELNVSTDQFPYTVSRFALAPKPFYAVHKELAVCRENGEEEGVGRNTNINIKRESLFLLDTSHPPLLSLLYVHITCVVALNIVFFKPRD